VIKKRINRYNCYLRITQILALRSTCLDKQVGCVITNNKNEIIATGYNGAPRGYQHCIDIGYCIKEKENNLTKCPSTHAEINALIQCRVPEQIHTVYITLSPCVACVRALMNTSCKDIVFIIEHKHPEAEELWRGRWIKHEID
jgi:dCMP deaminase